MSLFSSRELFDLLSRTPDPGALVSTHRPRRIPLDTSLAGNQIGSSLNLAQVVQRQHPGR